MPSIQRIRSEELLLGLYGCFLLREKTRSQHRVLLGTFLLLLSSTLASSALELPSAAEHPTAIRSLEPRGFIPNLGQQDPRILFYSWGTHHSAFFLEDEVVIPFRHGLDAADSAETQQPVEVLTLRFLEANESPEIQGLGESPSRLSFFPGKTRNRWRSGLSTFEQIAYLDLWPGTDLVFDTTPEGLKYELRIRPGARLQDVRLVYQGIRSAEVDLDGNLVIETKSGTLSEEKPFSYQDFERGRAPVDIGFRVLSLSEGSAVIGFEALEEYAEDSMLVVDPAIVFSTYFGGDRRTGSTEIESFTDLAFDSQGNVFVTARINTLGFPTTDGTQNSSEAIILSKFDPTLSDLLFSTILCGGDSNKCGWPQDLVLDSQDRIYLSGSANSIDFPTTSTAYQRDRRGGSDAFVMQLRPDGEEILYASLLGGDEVQGIHGGNDGATSLAVDPQGFVYIGGSIASPTFPTTETAFDRVFHAGRDGRDGFVAKFDPSQSGEASLIYSTILGGECDICTIADTRQEGRIITSEQVRDVAVDDNGYLFVVGTATSADFPTTSLAFDTSFSGRQDAFVAKIAPDGESLVYSTFLGGGLREYGAAIEIDEQGNAYVTGYTTSGDFPTTPGAFDREYADEAFRPMDGFVAKLNADGSDLVFGTYLGEHAKEFLRDIDRDSRGNLYIVGDLLGDSYPTTEDAFPLPDGSSPIPAVLTKLSGDGSELLFSTLLGGSGTNYGMKVRVDDDENAWILGRTNSENFPTTPLAYARVRQGEMDGFITKISTRATTDLLVDSVLPDSGGNSGPVTVIIQGSGFEPGSQAVLSGDPLSSDLVAAPVILTDPSTLQATFELATVPLGIYDIWVENPDGARALLPLSFSVEPRVGGVNSQVIGRESISIRQGGSDPQAWRFKERIFIMLENGSNQDSFVPFSFFVPESGNITDISLVGGIQESVTTPEGVFHFPATKRVDGGYLTEGVAGLSARESKPLALEITYSCGTSTTDVRVSVGEPIARDSAWACGEALLASFLNVLFDLRQQPFGNCVVAGTRLALTIQRAVNSQDPLNNVMSLDVALFQLLRTAVTCIALVRPDYVLASTILSVGARILEVGAQCFVFNSEGTLFRQRFTCGVSSDPNVKYGPAGVEDSRYVAGGSTLQYAIHFENMSDATAPAQDVVVSDVLDPATLDLSTVRPLLFTLGDRVAVPDRTAPMAPVELDLRPDLDLLVRVETQIDEVTNTLSFRLASIDPLTGAEIDDSSLDGFLLPNEAPPEGEGILLFEVQMLEDLPTETIVSNQASIVFDSNEAIVTPVWFNTVDSSAPTSRVEALEAAQCASEFEVRWTGQDTGSGVAEASILFAEDGGDFAIWRERVTDDSVLFSGQPGVTYDFVSQATDRVGNREISEPLVSQTTTQIVLDQIPPTTVASLPTAPNSGPWYPDTVQVQLVATDAPAPCIPAELSWSLSGAAQASQTVQGASAAVGVSSEGLSTLTFSARDHAGNTETPQEISIGIDRTPPAILGLPPEPLVLWPPNHTMVEVMVLEPSDELSGIDWSTLDIEVLSNEADQGLDAFDLPSDIVVESNGSILLRAERAARGSGRLYQVRVRVQDLGGNEVEEFRQVEVPISRSLDEEGLVLWASFDENGSPTVDGGNGYSGEVRGSADWQPGQQGSAFGIDGMGYAEFEDLDEALDLNGAFTLALWLRPDALGSHQMLISKDDAYELEIGLVGHGEWNLRLNNTIVGAAQTPLREGTWQHLAVTWDGEWVRFFRNGLPDGSYAFADPVAENDRSVGLGARPSPPETGGPTFHFQGSLDEIRIYERALEEIELVDLVATSTSDTEPPRLSGRIPSGPLPTGTLFAELGFDTHEIAECRYDQVPGIPFAEMTTTLESVDGLVHRQSHEPTQDITPFFVRCRDALGNTNSQDSLTAILLGNVDLTQDLDVFWEFEEGTGCIASDSALAGAHGTLGPNCTEGNSPLWSAARRGLGLEFDGGDDRVTMPIGESLGNTGGLTLSAWIRHAPTTQFRAIFDARDSTTDGYDLYITDQSTLFMRVNSSFVSSAEIVADSRWHHVVGAFDGTRMTLYIDGLPVASEPLNASVDIESDLYLGHHFSQTGNSFAGFLDEVVLYSRALSETEVYQLYIETGW